MFLVLEFLTRTMKIAKISGMRQTLVQSFSDKSEQMKIFRETPNEPHMCRLLKCRKEREGTLLSV